MPIGACRASTLQAGELQVASRASKQLAIQRVSCYNLKLADARSASLRVAPGRGNQINQFGIITVGILGTVGDPSVADSGYQEKEQSIPHDDRLPDPRPPLKHPPLMDLSFAALGWLYRLAQAVGGDRFEETANRAQFYLEKASACAHTPAELAVLASMHGSLDALKEVDIEARELLGESVSGIADACAAEVDQLLRASRDC